MDHSSLRVQQKEPRKSLNQSQPLIYKYSIVYNTIILQDAALLFWGSTWGLVHHQSGTSGIFENFTDTFSCLCRAFKILVSTNFLCNTQALNTNKLLNLFIVVCTWIKNHTSSAVTGLWDVFLNSSIFPGSFLKSFLQATSRMGRPWQKWRTSEIHCSRR